MGFKYATTFILEFGRYLVYYGAICQILKNQEKIVLYVAKNQSAQVINIVVMFANKTINIKIILNYGRRGR